jgi:hypothetical protein
MQRDDRDLLDVLKFELNFLEKGGYLQSPREPWRPKFIFEDSPACMNYDSKSHPDPCDKCVLIQLVPPEFRDAKVPCQHIPFTNDGETLDSLYRYADQFEIEEIVGKWLRTTIAKLEQERQGHQSNSASPSDSSKCEEVGVPLCRNLHPKCANPACPTAFHWLGGGKFFRFRPDGAVENSGRCVRDARGNLHGVKHFWLCEHCSHVFTLVYQEKAGVLLRLRWQGLTPVDPPKEIPETGGTEAKDLRQAAKA